MRETLGDYGDYGDVGEYGNVDFLGLDEFGQPVGMNPMYGAMVGAGLATGAAIGLRNLAAKGSFWNKYAEGVGFLAGAAAGGAMMFSPGTRAAGLTGIATAFITNGLRQLETLFATPSAAFGLPYIEPTRSFGGPVIEPTRVLTGNNGFGLVLPELQDGSYGNTGVAGPQFSEGPPIDISLQGALSASAIEQITGIEGPDLSGLGTHYGATLFGSRQ